MNESLPIQWSGYPLYPSDPPEDYSKDPCTWYWYKDPDAIPERHWSRYGAIKPGSATALSRPMRRQPDHDRDRLSFSVDDDARRSRPG